MTDTKPVRLGVVGCGVVSTAYYLPFIMDYEQAELVAVCDLEPRRTAAAARLFGASEQYNDYFEMLDHAQLDAVLILTAPGTHAKFSLAAIDKGLHLLIQKPMCLTLEEADTIADSVRAKGLKCLAEPSSHSVLHPQLAEARALVDQGALGDPYWFSLVPNAGNHYNNMLGGNPYGNAAFFAKDSGGILFDYPYYPSQIVSLLGSCKSITANAKISVPDRYIIPDEGYTEFLEHATDPHDCNYWDIALNAKKTEKIEMGAPDNVFSTYELDSGWTGVVHVGRPFHPSHPSVSGGGDLQVYGRGGNVLFSTGHYASVISERKDLLPQVDENGWYHIDTPPTPPGSRGWPHYPPGSFNYYAESTRHLCECILNDTEPLTNADYGRHITEMMFGSIESAKTGKRYDMTTTTTGKR